MARIDEMCSVGIELRMHSPVQILRENAFVCVYVNIVKQMYILVF